MIYSEAQKRGMVWVITGIVGIIGYFNGMDVTPVILLGTAIAGGLGYRAK